jgi:hypothetical protein
MAQKLKNMKYTSVDLVPRGANPKADIKLYKSADVVKGGENDMDENAIEGIVNKVVDRIKKALPFLNRDEPVNKAAAEAAKSETFDTAFALHETLAGIIEDPDMSSVQKSAAMEESLEEFNEEIAKSFDDWSEGRAHIAKSSITPARLEALRKSKANIESVLKANSDTNFADTFATVDITENMWKANDTLRTIFQNILSDDSIKDKKSALASAIDDYADFMKSKIGGMTIQKVKNASTEENQDDDPETDPAADGDPAEDDQNHGKPSVKPAVGKPKKGADGEKKPDDKATKVKKGGKEPMLDTEKMSPEDKTAYEGILKKYEVPDTDPEPTLAQTELNPEVKKALEDVADLRKSLEMKDLQIVAKKYEAIGKNSEELAPKLYDLKKAGGTAYDDYIAILDEMCVTSANSGIFKEFGSNAAGSVTGDLNGYVSEIRKAHPELSQAQAIVKAYEEHPDLDEVTGSLRK